MCFESIIPLAIGTALSVGGGLLNKNENDTNAANIATARNDVLASQLGKNNVIANESRGVFNDRLAQVQPAATGQLQTDVTGQRANSINSNMPTINASTFPGAADSSSLVKSSVAKAIGDALATSQQRATAHAKLGGFGDTFQRMGLQDTDASNKIGTSIGFAQANNALTPSLQDFAEQETYKPNSGIGGLFQGIGNAFGSYAGAHG